VEDLGSALAKINAAGLSILLVEQDVITALELSQHAFVMDSGRIVRHGPSQTLANDPLIRDAYLGVAPAVTGSVPR
jgi:branched-chain amino acid transport system ATP-binding protein